MPITLHGKTGLLCMHRFSQQVLLLFFFLASLQPVQAQMLTLSLKRASLETAFRAIEAQVPQRFVYTSEMLAQSRPVTLNLTRAPLQNALDQLFEDQPLQFSLDTHFITVRFRTAAIAPPGIDVHGRVTDATGQALAGVSVRGTASGLAAATDGTGAFTLYNVPKNDVLLLTSIGYADKRVAVSNRGTLSIQLDVAYSALDETVVMAYGTTTRRQNTGSIVRVTSEEISRQPLTNPLGALAGRVAGLVVTQSGGLPGSKFNLELRGRNSIGQGSEPLIIIDGVPFAPGNAPINLIASAVGSGGASGLSALHTLNPQDIESIEVLKDADATAIYGSRGANGVILITTKKGKAGETRCSAQLYWGRSRVTRTMDLLTTPQYLQMRHEAFTNDALTPDLFVAPDLVAWDTTRYTDFKKLLIGNTAATSDAQVSVSGGSASTRFLIGAGYHQESTVFPGSLGDRKVTFHSNLTHIAPDRKFSAALSINYGADRSTLTGTDLSAYLNLPPNLQLYDTAGHLNWQEGGVSYGLLGLTNPLAALLATYQGRFDNLLGNLQLGYKLSGCFHFKLSLGYNAVTGDEQSLTPSTAIDPVRGLLPYASFANSAQQSFIAEPQGEYLLPLGNGRLQALLGATWQEVQSRGTSLYASDYTSDLLLSSVAAAGSLVAMNTSSQYRYAAGFGRLNYNYREKYLLNVSGRRDGSSRFGTQHQLATFGAIGAAWIFSKEGFLPHSLLSFGKLRGSYGTTGNDQIGDYKFLETWTATPLPYQGVPGLRPTSLYNPDYGWEINRKLEGALELGFWQDNVLLTAAFFRNRCSNQLVNYSLPIQTGFPSVGQNIAAELQNSGLELQLAAKTGSSRSLTWRGFLTVSRTRNKLVAFPGLEKTTYAQNYVIGEPLSTRKVYGYLGVDPTTGIYRFEDVNQDDAYDVRDRIRLVHTDPQFYGGLTNTVTFRSLELSMLVEFRKQQGLNYLFTQSQYIPGYYYFNQPQAVLQRWQRPGDRVPVQKFAATEASTAFVPAAEYLGQSAAVYSDASFIRLKTLSLSYTVPPNLLKPIGLAGAVLYVHGQNLLTLTRYQGADPENQNLYVLPPLKTITAGLQLNF